MKRRTALVIGYGFGRIGREERLPITKGVVLVAIGVGIGYTASVQNQELHGELERSLANFTDVVASAFVRTMDTFIEQEQARTREERTETQAETVNGTAEEVAPTAIDDPDPVVRSGADNLGPEPVQGETL